MKNMIKNRATAALAAAALAAAGLTLGIAPAQPAHAATTCGIWRWPVKTGSDATRFQVSPLIHYTSVGYLDGRSAPSSFTSYAQDHRIKIQEFKIWQVRATLVALKLEDDGDIHVRLSSSGHNMIAEVPLGSCVSSASLWKTQIANARSYLTSRYSVSLYSWHYVYRTVTIRGLGFFDEEHGVTGAAPNDIELHPVIHIRFL
jgi:hypothetical protein